MKTTILKFGLWNADCGRANFLQFSSALHLLLVLGLGLILPNGVNASTNYTAAAQVSQPFLGVNVGARGVAMGEAFTSVADDVFALQWNPAGLDYLRYPQVGLMHNEWNSALGMRQEFLALAERIGSGGAGIAINYFSLGSFDNRDANGAPIDQTTDYDLGASVGYGMTVWRESLHLGGMLELGQENLSGYSSNLVDGGIGLLYQFSDFGKLGASLMHVGISTNGATPPTQAALGASYGFFSNALLLSGELVKPFAGNSGMRAGIEWTPLDKLSLRAGYRYTPNPPDGDVSSSFAAGLGTQLGPLRLDYAYVPYGILGSAHRISALFTFSDDLFGTRIIVEANGTSAVAQTNYEEGIKAYGARDWYVAKVAFNSCLKVAPDFPKANEITSLMKDIDKHIAEEKAGGGNPETRRKMMAHIDQAKQLMQRGKLKEAKLELDAVMQFDPTIHEAKILSDQIKDRLDQQVAKLLSEGDQARQADNLSKAVADYREVLKIDYENREAKNRLEALKGKISQAIKSLHRQGIDKYLEGKIKRAIQLWQEALDLEPSDPDNIKRDIDKANKLLELQNSTSD